MEGDSAMVRVENISFRYNESEEVREIITSVNLEVKPGECILLCGRSGCGKSTLLKLMNGVIPHLESGSIQGKVLVDHQKVADVPMYVLAKKIGTVFQNPKSQFFNLDSDSELSFELENVGMKPEDIFARMNEVTEELEIHHLRKRNIFAMSGGEKQLLAIAAVYCGNPDIYILDEPTANLDYLGTLKLKKLLEKLKKQGKTIIIAEHRLWYLNGLVDHVYYMQQGTITEQFKGEEFFALPNEKRISLGLRQLTERTLSERLKGRRGKYDFVCSNLSVCFEKRKILDSLTFKARKGEIIGIVGENGAGKSTFCRTICGLVSKTAGQFQFEGGSWNEKQRRAKSFFVMQDVNHQLFSDSVYNECLESMEEEDENQIRNILKRMGLEGMEMQHPMALSGGQKQRLAIATGLLSGRLVYLFDEPSSGLDYESMLKVKEIMEELAQNGAIILLITHDMELLDLVCDRCVYLEKGKITEIFREDCFSTLVKKMLLGTCK